MKCQVCGKPKQTVHPKKSALMVGHTFLICDACKEKKYEPRHLIILVARSKGPATVREHLLKRLYVGEEINATDIVT